MGAGQPAGDGVLSAAESLWGVNPFCGSWLASEGGLTADQFLTGCIRSNGESWLASDDTLTANHSSSNTPGSTCGSQPAGDGVLSAAESLWGVNPFCGSWLASEGGLTADQFLTGCIRSNGESWLASDDTLTANHSSSTPGSNCGSRPACWRWRAISRRVSVGCKSILWERACSRRRLPGNQLLIPNAKSTAITL
ncbi:hypothetical protein ATI02_6036 [Pseudomonas baetica]|uniref:Uncharacterized protein n=1 Tax=Pseudomonas baetica TaxID=674054 RepID=A0ABX4Q805_9PSED|nr:hypothetical protein ATI02_6036 [Pseudomonas baetica]